MCFFFDLTLFDSVSDTRMTLIKHVSDNCFRCHMYHTHLKELNMYSIHRFDTGFQVLMTAVEQLIENNPSEKMTYDQLVWLYTIMIFATAVKLALWFYCRTSRNKIVLAYADVWWSSLCINCY